MLDESQAGINTARRNINNLRYADDITLIAESKEKLKSLLMRVKEESEKASWKLNIKKTKIISEMSEKQLLDFNRVTKIGFIYYHLSLLIFLPAILIPACALSSPAFHMMYSAYKLNKQGDNIQPCCIPFPIWNQSVVPCPVLTVAS